MRRIVVIGASSGIGHAVAEAYARAGWCVGVVARREEPLRRLAASFPRQIEYSVFDVAAEGAEKSFLELVERLGGMDLLLYAAGCGWYNPALEIDDDMRTVLTNVVGFTKIVDAAFGYFSQRADGVRGRIAAITSIAGVKGLGITAAYSASKRYQWTYLQSVEQLARLRGVNVDITDIRPGFIATSLLSRGPKHLPMTMPLDYAASRIIKALKRGRRVAVIDYRWAVVCALWRLIPNCLWPHLPIFKPKS